MTLVTRISECPALEQSLLFEPVILLKKNGVRLYPYLPRNSKLLSTYVLHFFYVLENSFKNSFEFLESWHFIHFGKSDTAARYWF